MKKNILSYHFLVVLLHLHKKSQVKYGGGGDWYANLPALT
jgi:hypothetical protein